MNHRTFRTSFRRYVFDTRYQNGHIGPQQIQLNFNFSAAFVDIICNALVLNKSLLVLKVILLTIKALLYRKD